MLETEDLFATIHLMSDSDLPAVLGILRSLPNWFSDNAIETIVRDVSFQKGMVAMLQSRVVGFVTFYVAKGKGHIGCMAIAAGHHRRGIGRMLLECLEDTLGHAGVAELYLDMPGETTSRSAFDPARAFFRKMGFSDHHRLFSSDPDCAEILSLVKKLSPR